MEKQHPKVTMPRRLPVLIAGLALTLMVVLVYTWYIGWRMNVVYGPLNEAAHELEKQTTLAHLWAMEILAGNTSVSVEIVSQHLDRIDWLSQAMLDGGQDDRFNLRGTEDEQMRQAIGEVRQSLAQFAGTLHSRLKKGGSSGYGINVDGDCDSVFEQFHQRVHAFEESVSRAAARDGRNFLYAQLVMAVVGLFLLVLVLRSFWMWERRRKAYLDNIYVTNELMQAEILDRARAEESLRQSEERYRSLVDLSPDAIAVHSEGKLVYVNRAGLILFGAGSLEDIVGKPILGFVHPDSQTVVRRRMEMMAQDGKHQELVQEKMVRLDGEPFDAEVVAVPITYSGTTAVQVIVRDITERKRVEEKLQVSEEQLRQITDNVSVGFFLSDTSDDSAIYVSPAYEQIWGRPVEFAYASAQSWMEMVHPEDRERVNAYIEKHGRGKIAFSQEYRILRPDGSIRWVRDRVYPVKIESGEISRIVGVTEDITERKQAEEIVHQSEEGFRNLFNSAIDAIYIHDEQGRFLDVNRGAELMYGYTREEFLGHTPEMLAAPGRNDMAEIERRIQKALEGKPQQFEFWGKRKNGEVFPKIVRLSSGMRQGQKVLFAFALDITEHKRVEEKLKENEERYRILFESAGDAIFAMDGERFVDCNAKTLEMFGCTRDQIIGTPPYQFSPAQQPDGEDSRDKAIEKINLALKEGPHSFEWLHCRYDGTPFHAEVSLNKIELSGKPFLQAIVRDITNRKKVEEALRDSQKRLSLHMQQVPLGVIEWNTDFEVTQWNPAAERIFGYTCEEALGRHAAGLIVPESAREHVDKVWQDLLSQKGGTRSTNENNTRSGKTILCEWYNTPLVDDQNRVIGAASLIQDVTERKQAEEELHKLSAAVTQSANMIVITDPIGIIEYVNPQFSRTTGYSIIEAVGQPASILKSGKQDNEYYKSLWETITTGKTWIGNLQNQRKDGSIYWERKTITPVQGYNHEIVNYLAVGEDITTEVITQQKLVDADKMSAIGMLAAGISHEFKNYLAGIIGNASFALGELQEEGGLELAGETLEKVVELGERANEVAMSLLSYSKARVDDFNREDVRKIIQKSVNFVDKELKNLSIEVVTYFEDVPEVEVSASKIQQLLLNLLINARHAIKSDGVISIAVINAGDHLAIKVADTGSGIPTGILGKIFDPFFSTKGVWGKDELVGTGMGLAICRNIAREHGGDLTVESIEGIGTTFQLTLPSDESGDGGQTIKMDGRVRNVLIFTLDKSIVSQYFQAACEIDARIITVDDITKLPEDFDRMVDLVVCDARFSGKVELLRMVESCRKAGVPYMMVNCGTMEYQMSDLYEDSKANFKQLPDFSKLVGHAVGSEPRKLSS
ncbi:MAG: PAS domain S-box protein [bacterium]